SGFGAVARSNLQAKSSVTVLLRKVAHEKVTHEDDHRSRIEGRGSRVEDRFIARIAIYHLRSSIFHLRSPIFIVLRVQVVTGDQTLNRTAGDSEEIGRMLAGGPRLSQRPRPIAGVQPLGGKANGRPIHSTFPRGGGPFFLCVWQVWGANKAR